MGVRADGYCAMTLRFYRTAPSREDVETIEAAGVHALELARTDPSLNHRVVWSTYRASNTHTSHKQDPLVFALLTFWIFNNIDTNNSLGSGLGLELTAYR
jgi:hypothetical protein